MSDNLYNVKRMLLESARAEPDQFKASRRLSALAAAALGGAAVAPTQLGCLEGDDELGAFGGVADIPQGLWEMQQWAGRADAPTPTVGKPLLRVDLPRLYARDWTIQLATPLVPPGAAVQVPSTFAATVRMRWGHHGSTDEVVFSWPERGGSMVVHGCFLELFVVDTTPAATATASYNAWLSEGAGARGALPTFQPMRQQLAAGTLTPVSPTQLFILSPRARSVYFVARSSNPVGIGLDYTLLDNLVARFSGVILPQSSNSPLGAESYMREPLLIPPLVNAVLFNNTTADNWDVSIVEMLDI